MRLGRNWLTASQIKTCRLKPLQQDAIFFAAAADRRLPWLNLNASQRSSLATATSPTLVPSALPTSPELR